MEIRMRNQIVSEQLYTKYIAPTEQKRESFIGIEIELPIVNLKKEAVSFDVVFSVTDLFLKKFAFEADGIDSAGHIYAAQNKEFGDILSYDCSYNNLELSMGKEKDLHALHERFCRYFRFLQEEFGKYDHMLTGMGINPYRGYNHNVPIENERYRMLFHHLGSYTKYTDKDMYFHPYPQYGTYSSASQVQLDVDKKNLIKTIRAFSKLEPIKAHLFSNSVLLGDREDIICCRDMMWENSTHGINPHNVGMFASIPESVEELLAYIESESLYCVMRDGKYINFEPVNVMDYFEQESVTGEYFDGENYQDIIFTPEIGDLEYLRTFKFEDLTFRGTIEYRSVCCQPVSDAMTVAAFHVGLLQKLDELDALLANDHVLYHHGYTASELRKLFTFRKLPGFVNEYELQELSKKIVDLAAMGLKKRNLGEEVYLEPLYRRIESGQNPAEHMLSELEKGTTIEEVIREYGTID